MCLLKIQTKKEITDLTFCWILENVPTPLKMGFVIYLSSTSVAVTTPKPGAQTRGTGGGKNHEAAKTTV